MDDVSKNRHPSTAVYGDQIKPGTILMFLGTPHLVALIEPYDRHNACGIARCSDGWGITLFAGVAYEAAALAPESRQAAA